VGTLIVDADSGSLAWQGLLGLPDECRQFPQELVFLDRQTHSSPFCGASLLYAVTCGIR